MSDRISHSTAIFSHPFVLPGMDGVQQPGLYDIETIEAELGLASASAYRRISTTITPRAGGTLSRPRQMSVIEPSDLAAALERDAAESAL